MATFRVRAADHIWVSRKANWLNLRELSSLNTIATRHQNRMPGGSHRYSSSDVTFRRGQETFLASRSRISSLWCQHPDVKQENCDGGSEPGCDNSGSSTSKS